jgi:hypothetical protein
MTHVSYALSALRSWHDGHMRAGDLKCGCEIETLTLHR